MKRKKAKQESGDQRKANPIASAQHSEIKVDLNFPGFARSLQEVSLEELQEFMSKVNQIQNKTLR